MRESQSSALSDGLTLCSPQRRVASSSSAQKGCSQKKGDMVVTLYGSSVPVILQKRYNKTCEVIGQCYFEDKMFGEVMTLEEDDADTFVLQ